MEELRDASEVSLRLVSFHPFNIPLSYVCNSICRYERREAFRFRAIDKLWVIEQKEARQRHTNKTDFSAREENRMRGQTGYALCAS